VLGDAPAGPRADWARPGSAATPPVRSVCRARCAAPLNLIGVIMDQVRSFAAPMLPASALTVR
jgi:hypothetical protein